MELYICPNCNCHFSTPSLSDAIPPEEFCPACLLPLAEWYKYSYGNACEQK